MAFGEGPLRLPLLVEAAETEFIPVAIRNNVAGYEEEIRERFEEPSWNNPVVRFLDSDGVDLIPRKDGVWKSGALLARMVLALEKAEREVPVWLRTVAAETASGEVETALFAMTWYWVGEAQLGSLEGVVSSRVGWIGPHEVVELQFRPSVLPFEKLLEAAIARSCDQRVFAQDDAQFTSARARLGAESSKVERYDLARHGALRPVAVSEGLYYLSRAPERFLPLTPAQSRQVNAALGASVLGAEVAGTDADVDAFLSPRQRALLPRIRAVLEEDSKALDDLSRPDGLDALAAYAARLERALE